MNKTNRPPALCARRPVCIVKLLDQQSLILGPALWRGRTRPARWSRARAAKWGARRRARNKLKICSRARRAARRSSSAMRWCRGTMRGREARSARLSKSATSTRALACWSAATARANRTKNSVSPTTSGCGAGAGVGQSASAAAVAEFNAAEKELCAGASPASRPARAEQSTAQALLNSSRYASNSRSAQAARPSARRSKWLVAAVKSSMLHEPSTAVSPAQAHITPMLLYCELLYNHKPGRPANLPHPAPARGRAGGRRDDRRLIGLLGLPGQIRRPRMVVAQHHLHLAVTSPRGQLVRLKLRDQARRGLVAQVVNGQVGQADPVARALKSDVVATRNAGIPSIA